MTQVQRVDHADPEEAGVIQLQVAVAVDGQHRETVAPAHSQLVLHGVGEAQDPVAVRRPGGVVVLVVEADPVGVTAHGGQQLAVVDELLHA